MRRLAVCAVVLATALSLGSLAQSATITFDLEGVVGSYSRSTDMNAAIPGPPTNGGLCAPGMESPPAPGGAGNNCFRYPFSAGSSLSIDITGDRAEFLGGTLIVDSVTPLVFDTIVLTQHREWTLDAGLIGTVTGDYITWISPENAWMNWVSYSDTGTIACNGPNCPLISMAEGEVYPVHPLFDYLSNTSPYPGLYFGQWQLNAAHDTILASTTTVHAYSNVDELINRNQGAFTFGPTSLGIVCPEPGASALVLLGVAGLALRSRRVRSR